MWGTVFCWGCISFYEIPQLPLVRWCWPHNFFTGQTLSKWFLEYLYFFTFSRNLWREHMCGTVFCWGCISFYEIPQLPLVHRRWPHPIITRILCVRYNLEQMLECIYIWGRSLWYFVWYLTLCCPWTRDDAIVLRQRVSCRQNVTFPESFSV